MSGVNKVILVGRLGGDPEVRHLEDNLVMARFSLATTEYYKDRNTGERRETTEWHNVVLWRRLAELAEKYLKKGSQLYVEGKLRTRSWQDKEGQERRTTEVIGSNMTFLGGNSQSSAKPQTTPQASGNVSAPQTGGDTGTVAEADTDLEDDLPF